RPDCSDVMRFQPGSQQSKRNGEKEKGDKRDKVGEAQLWSLPPDENGENDRQRAGYTFAEEGAQKQSQGKSKPLPFSRRLTLLQIFKSQISKNTPKEKCSRQGVFDLSDPGNRFDHHRMDCKNCGGKPGRGQAKFAENQREKNGI